MTHIFLLLKALIENKKKTIAFKLNRDISEKKNEERERGRKKKFPKKCDD